MAGAVQHSNEFPLASQKEPDTGSKSSENGEAFSAVQGIFQGWVEYLLAPIQLLLYSPFLRRERCGSVDIDKNNKHWSYSSFITVCAALHPLDDHAHTAVSLCNGDIGDQ